MASLTVATTILAGCSDPETQDSNKPDCTPVPGDPCPDGTGDSETGGGGDAPAEPTPLDSTQCKFNHDSSIIGHRIQCEGTLSTEIDFDIDILDKDCVELIGSSFCLQSYDFGPPNDTYEAPDVMTCCGEDWDPDQHFDTYAKFCISDVVDQACLSLAKRLEKHIEDGDFDTAYGDFTDKATNLQAWIALRYEACVDALLDNDTDPDPAALDSHWSIPDKAGAEGWKPATGVVFRIKAGTVIDDLHRPDDPQDWLTCTGSHHNDDEIFEDQSPPVGGVVVLVDLETEVDGELIGPILGGGPITAATSFQPGCVAQGCPSASWSHDPLVSSFTLEELKLYGGNFKLSNGDLALTVDRARIELWTQAPGVKLYDGGGRVVGYEVPAGEAWFYLAGVSDETTSRFMAVNSTAIELTQTGKGWHMASFELESVDGAGRVWTIVLDDSDWR